MARTENRIRPAASKGFTLILRQARFSLFRLAWLTLSAAAVLAGPSDRPGMGSIVHDQGTTFRVWAPNASSVAVAGDFSRWNQVDMFAEGNGNWSIDIGRDLVGSEYKYVIDGDLWRRDPRARQVTHSAGNSIVYDAEAFDWGDVSFSTPFRNDTVIYQMHVGTFAGSPAPATFDDAIPRLDHIRDLGVTAIKVMPINEFAGQFSWGYNPADLFAIESNYGGPDAFKRFVKAAHQRGIAVLVDIVHNHYGPGDLDLWRFDGWYQNDLGGIYFYNDHRAVTPWGDTRPDFGRSEVRAFIRDQVFMFLEEYRVDGFRWDSIFNMVYTDNGANHNPDGESLVRDINWEMEQTYPERIRIAEDHAFDFNMNFHGQWDVANRWVLRDQLVQPSDDDRDMWAVRDALNVPGHQRVLFTEAHDYIAAAAGRTRMPGDIDGNDPDSIWARKRALLGGGLVMTAPGMPMIFQGQEMHETLAFEDTTELRWERLDTHAGIVEAYRDLIRLRRNLDGGTQGLKGPNINVHHIDNDNKVLGFIRWDAGGQTDDVVVVANFSAQTWTGDDYSIGFPSEGTWYSHFNSDARRYQEDFGDIGHSEITASGSPAAANVNMGAYSIQVFSKTPPADLVDSNDDGIPDWWYLEHGFDPAGPSVADIDSDGDGFTNREAFLLGIDPRNPHSTFRIVDFRLNDEGFAQLTWTSVGGRTYLVEYADRPDAGFSEIIEVTEEAVDEGIESTRTFIHDNRRPGDTGRIYRVRLKIENP